MSDVKSLARGLWPPALLILLVTVVTAIGASGPDSLRTTTMSMLVNLVLVVGLATFVGGSGVLSFGHMAFAAIGAYATAILAIDPEQKELLLPELVGFLQGVHLAPVPATIAGGLVAAVFGLILSVPLMRLSGLSAGLATFAVLLAVNGVADNLTAVTNADIGISGIPASFGVWSLLAWAAAAIAVLFAYQQTASSLRLRASREEFHAARSAGVHVARERRIAFVLSAFVVGVGGGLFAQVQGAIQPNAFHLSLTFLTIAMLVVGGIGSLTGAVVGTLLLSIVGEALGRLENGTSIAGLAIDAPTGLREIGFAGLLLAVLIRRPDGLTGGREWTWPLGRSTPPPPTATGTGTGPTDASSPVRPAATPALHTASTGDPTA